MGWLRVRGLGVQDLGLRLGLQDMMPKKAESSGKLNGCIWKHNYGASKQEEGGSFSETPYSKEYDFMVSRLGPTFKNPRSVILNDPRPQRRAVHLGFRV